MRALAVTGASRTAAFPDVPTFAEEGLPGMTLTNWQGVGGPAGIPKRIIEKISGEIKKIVAMPDTQREVERAGVRALLQRPGARPPRFIKSDIVKYGKIIKEAKHQGRVMSSLQPAHAGNQQDDGQHDQLSR